MARQRTESAARVQGGGGEGTGQGRAEIRHALFTEGGRGRGCLAGQHIHRWLSSPGRELGGADGQHINFNDEHQASNMHTDTRSYQPEPDYGIQFVEDMLHVT